MSTTTKPTAREQKAALGAGLAVGCLTLGIAEISADQPAIEVAFARAWSTWPWASRFPAVQATVADREVVGILNDSAANSTPGVAHWWCDHGYLPQMREHWPVTRAGDHMERDTRIGVPYRGWVELAQTFVDGLDGIKVRRH